MINATSIDLIRKYIYFSNFLMVVLTKLPLMVLRNDKMDDEQQRIILITD